MQTGMECSSRQCSTAIKSVWFVTFFLWLTSSSGGHFWQKNVSPPSKQSLVSYLLPLSSPTVRLTQLFAEFRGLCICSFIFDGVSTCSVLPWAPGVELLSWESRSVAPGSVPLAFKPSLGAGGDVQSCPSTPGDYK